MSPLRKETPIERRLRELDELSRRVRGDIRSTERELRKLEPRPAAAVQDAPRTSRPQPRPRLNPNFVASMSTEPPAAIRVTDPESAPAVLDSDRDVNLFNFAPGPSVELPVERVATSTESLTTVTETRRRSAGAVPVTGVRRGLAKILSSGSFGRGSPLDHDHRVRRNKAIFAAVCAVVFGYIVLRALFF